MSLYTRAAQTSFTARLAPLLIVSALSLHTATAATPSTRPQETRKIAIDDFAAGSADQKHSPSDSVCDNATLTPEAADFLVANPDLPATISQEIAKKLTSKYEVLAAPHTLPLEAGTLVVSGCLTEVNPGSAAKRLVGMGLGSSRLAAHVVLSRQTGNGLVPVGAFDVAVKGGNLLPPLGPAGLAVHAAKEVRQTMDAQAKKLAGQVVKQLKKKDGTPTAVTANSV